MTTPDLPTHGDAGLQPERTDLAWGRTTMAMVVAAAVFLRWMPHHGWFVGTLVAAALITAVAINLTRKPRFGRAVHGITEESMPLTQHQRAPSRQASWSSPCWEPTPCSFCRWSNSLLPHTQHASASARTSIQAPPGELRRLVHHEAQAVPTHVMQSQPVHTMK